jgi:hypothetical protein
MIIFLLHTIQQFQYLYQQHHHLLKMMKNQLKNLLKILQKNYLIHHHYQYLTIYQHLKIFLIDIYPIKFFNFLILISIIISQYNELNYLNYFGIKYNHYDIFKLMKIMNESFLHFIILYDIFHSQINLFQILSQELCSSLISDKCCFV